MFAHTSVALESPGALCPLVYQDNCAVGRTGALAKRSVAAPAKARFRLRPMGLQKPADMYVLARRDQQTISTRLQGIREQFSGARANHRALLRAPGDMYLVHYFGEP